MGRRRATDCGLPERLNEKNGGFHYVYSESGRKIWELLSRDRPTAILLATELNAMRKDHRLIALRGMRNACEELRRDINDRDGWKCAYCGSAENLGIDHIIPYGAGGATLPFNLVTACGDCNSSKGMSDPREFIVMIGGFKERLLREFIRQNS